MAPGMSSLETITAPPQNLACCSQSDLNPKSLDGSIGPRQYVGRECQADLVRGWYRESVISMPLAGTVN